MRLFVLVSLVVVCAGFKVSPTRFHAKSSLLAGLPSCSEPISSRETVLQPFSTLSKAVAFAAFPALLSVLNVPVARAEANYPDWDKVRTEIVEIIRTKPDKGPTFVRLAWHSSGTYSKITNDGGSQKGTIRFAEELKHGANAGLDLAVSWLEPVYKVLYTYMCRHSPFPLLPRPCVVCRSSFHNYSAPCFHTLTHYGSLFLH